MVVDSLKQKQRQKVPSLEKARSYCQMILPRVSRTFALNIAVLRGDLYDAVLTTYLLCRMADTFEDSADFSHSLKEKLFQNFLLMFHHNTLNIPSLNKLKQSFHFDKTTESNDDYDLLNHCEYLFVLFFALSSTSKKIIEKYVREMCLGMNLFIKKQELNAITINDFKDLDRYCYYVAGTVGELLKDFFFIHAQKLSVQSKETMTKTAVSFGIGLQLTNIIKDLFQDNQRGAFYLPLEILTKYQITKEDFFREKYRHQRTLIIEELIQKGLYHLNHAIQFTLSLPRREKRLRLFCLWPIFLALYTLIVLKDNAAFSDENKTKKISRKTVLFVLSITKCIFWNNTCLTFYYKVLYHRIQKKLKNTHFS